MQRDNCKCSFTLCTPIGSNHMFYYHPVFSITTIGLAFLTVIP